MIKNGERMRKLMKFKPWSDPKDNLWKPSDERTSDDTAILWDGPDGPDVITDLFGNRVKIINTKQKEKTNEE